MKGFFGVSPNLKIGSGIHRINRKMAKISENFSIFRNFFQLNEVFHEKNFNFEN